MLAAAAACGSAAAQPPPREPPKVAAALDAFLAHVGSLTAEFHQELYSNDQRLLQTESGTFSLRRPNRFRWTYERPTELAVIADGQRLWIYDVELAQVTVAPLDTSVTSSPAMLLSGDGNVTEAYDVQQTYALDGLDWIKLKPKSETSDFVSILIGFRGEVPERLELVDGLNQVTRIEFAKLAVNPTLGDEVFEFTPPAGVDVIGGEG